MGLEESTKETKSSGKKPKRTILRSITCGRKRGSSKQEESGPPVHEEENSREQQRKRGTQRQQLGEYYHKFAQKHKTDGKLTRHGRASKIVHQIKALAPQFNDLSPNDRIREGILTAVLWPHMCHTYSTHPYLHTQQNKSKKIKERVTDEPLSRWRRNRDGINLCSELRRRAVSK